MAQARLANAGSTAENTDDTPGAPNGGDPVGDSQADYSGWGGIDECRAVTGARAVSMVFLDGPHRRQAAWRRWLKRLAGAH